MTIPPGGEIGEEVHEHGDQLLLFVEGEAEAILEGESRPVAPNGLVFRAGRDAPQLPQRGRRTASARHRVRAA